MTRDEQVAEALKLLAPAPEKLAECRRDIEAKLDQVKRLAKMQTDAKASKTKKGKAALRRYRKALQGLHSAYNALGDLKPWFSLDVMRTRTRTRQRVTRSEDSFRLRRSATLAKTAVPLACALLIRWGHDPAVTRNGKWEWMTKILVNTDKSVFEHIRAFKKLKPVIAHRPSGATHRVGNPGTR